MEQNFHQANHAGVVDLDAGEFGGAQGDRQGQALEQREIDMHVEAAGLEGGEAVSDQRNFSRTSPRCSRPFFSPKSARLLEQTSLRRKVANFSYCLTKAFFQ